ncbi:bifunctional UDP-N-acetylglucosamine diphosphorylase/glucosamine-1-phosphate N-acetyltransferase GlmU [Sphingorhabdus sp. M41]|uniref:bifunctional UDP-N-acetylglucosamine diphosphorylase/glucosamine-1-phosphate N-acetyltransferase GlmU n=1 Tax=Sphingorhabdus sp. M41 TaxID=1806885 RepID=UPI00078E1CBD|nr:bifunctional UDP-N-acetylglucosamine diphosphorylase/glucosamine-1-phosphate N-acetyltransferase GlmU [Sphingorhabdus sp. M41]AMO71861.1 bifunctional N-acetylglucosamine-1-phosphate uridyltransferase/glucosamine-1-phosphate acetyltransferase [Sphingorhabdus sp. M41]
MSDRPLAAIILAAGQGTRMKSEKHKVLHPIAGKPMLHHLLDTVDSIGVERTVIVVGARREQIEESVKGRNVAIAVQEDQLGTGHAVAQAHDALKGFAGDVLILYGDVPMVSADTMRDMIYRLNNGTDPRAVVLGFRPDDAGAYGRIIADDQGEIEKMVEYKDATDQERHVNLCNSGLMAARSTDLFILLDQISNDNAAGEYYLPDIVMLSGQKSAVIEVDDPAEVAGVNSRAELAAVEGEWQSRRREQAMADGVSLIAPDTVWFSHDTEVAADVVIEPNVIFGPGVSIASGAKIYGHSHIEGATIGPNCNVGPFARLRPGSVMEEGSKVGNFVEMKKTTLGKGAKANHLTYLGDAEVGEGANIGAGTITCNYDGYFKYKTVIGKGAFIGSNSALVAPVTVGDGVIVGAGATLTKDVAAGDLALVRAQQTVKAGWANRFNEVSARKKAKDSKS